MPSPSVRARSVGVACIALVLVPACSSGSTAHERVPKTGSTTTSNATRPASQDATPAPPGAEPDGAPECVAARAATRALQPGPPSRSRWGQSEGAWSALGRALPAPHDATARALSAAYGAALAQYGDGEQPSAASRAALDASVSAQSPATIALVTHVVSRCHVQLPAAAAT